MRNSFAKIFSLGFTNVIAGNLSVQHRSKSCDIVSATKVGCSRISAPPALGVWPQHFLFCDPFQYEMASFFFFFFKLLFNTTRRSTGEAKSRV